MRSNPGEGPQLPIMDWNPSPDLLAQIDLSLWERWVPPTPFQLISPCTSRRSAGQAGAMRVARFRPFPRTAGSAKDGV